MKEYKARTKRLRWTIGAVLSGCLFMHATYAQSTDNEIDLDEEDVYELSPFVIETDENVGYLATSTLAGTRLKTDLKDVGSAISVVTPEFLEDTGATSAEDLLVYTVSTEVGGSLGNFAGGGAAAGDESANSNARGNPMSNTRVRGLSRAAATRDYFLTDFGFDSYNTEGVTISRGPNSILFGIGEPGGIIENSIKKALMGSDISRVALRVGSRGTHRQSIDFNRDIIEDRLAIRVMAMNERIEFQQQPAYEEDRRWTIAATANILTNEDREWMGPTVVRVNYENAEIRGTPPNMTPPKDTYSNWWAPASSPEADAMVGYTGWDAEFRENYASQFVVDRLGDGNTEGNRHAGQAELWGSYALVYGDRTDSNPNLGVGTNLQVIDGASGAFDLTLPGGETVRTPGWFPTYSTNTNPFGNHPGFQRLSIIDTKIFNWKKYLIGGKNQFANHDFEVVNATLEQNFFDNKLGFQLAFDRQERDRATQFSMGRHHYAAVRIDTGAYLPNGMPNPNLGRPLITGQIDPTHYNHNERDTMRFTGYYKLDFSEKDGFVKWLGDHTANVLMNKYEEKTHWYGEQLVWDYSDDPSQQDLANQSPVASWAGRVFYWAYVGDPQWGASDPSQLRLYQDYMRYDMPKVGDTLSNYYWDGEGIRNSTIKIAEGFVGPGGRNQKIDSEAFTLQSKWLKGHIVTTFGWRKDSAKTYEIIGDNTFRDPDTHIFDRAALTEGWLKSDGSVGTYGSADPVLDQSGNTSTKQVVAHVPESWMKFGGDFLTGISFHWAESENFNPASIRRDIEGEVIGHPSGETTEHGVALTLMDGKAYVKLNWYETSSKNVNNQNYTGMWQLTWPIGLADRWLSAKNSSFENDDSLQFSDYAYWDLEGGGAGQETDNPTYIPERLGNFQSFDEIINAFLASIPENAGYEVEISGELGDQQLTRVDPNGLSNVADLLSEGFEIEAVYNITSNWRVAFNASKTESTFGNSLKKITPYVDAVTANLQSLGLWGIADSPHENGTVEDRWTNGSLNDYWKALSKDGTVSTELRKWRWSAVTNYAFSDGVLEGLSIGGALRWSDSVSTGYPLLTNENGVLVPDLKNPYSGGSRVDGDLWFGYKTVIKGYPVKFQLNLQNYLGDSDNIEVAHNPDGVLAVVRAAPEKRWFLTTTIDF